MSAPAPDPIPQADARKCVFCGAVAVHRGQGRVEWVVSLATPPDCEHETIYGQD